jgi:hypothetical protein
MQLLPPYIIHGIMDPLLRLCHAILLREPPTCSVSRLMPVTRLARTYSLGLLWAIGVTTNLGIYISLLPSSSIPHTLNRGVTSDTYSPGHDSSVKWVGPYYQTVPASGWHATVTGDPTSRKYVLTLPLFLLIYLFIFTS